MNKEKIIKALKWFFNSFIWLAIVLLVLDIVSKNIVVQNADAIRAGGGRNGGIDIIPGFLGINYIINEKIAFGLMIGTEQATQIIFSILAVLIVIIIVIYLIKQWGKTNRFYKACLMMIIAGALGNVIDRVFYSAEYLNYVNASGKLARGVVDFIDFYGIWGFNFNVADSCVVVAAFMMIIYVIVTEIIEYRKKVTLEKAKESEPVKEEKVLSATEQEKIRLLEEDKEDKND